MKKGKIITKRNLKNWRWWVGILIVVVTLPPIILFAALYLLFRYVDDWMDISYNFIDNKYSNFALKVNAWINKASTNEQP